MSVTGLINKVAHSLIGTMTLRPLSFLSEWVLIRSCGRVVLRLSLQQWTVISLQWKYSSRSWAIHLIWKWTKRRKNQATELFWDYIFMLHKLLCVPLYENGSFLQSLGWSEREQTLGACVLINIRDTVYFIGLELPYTLLTLFRSFRFFLEESPNTNLQELGWIKVSWVGARWT